MTTTEEQAVPEIAQEATQVALVATDTVVAQPTETSNIDPQLSMKKKKQEFKSYLKEEGLMESLTKAMRTLYEQGDKPKDPRTFIASLLNGQELEQLRKENQELKEKVESLETEVKTLKESHLAVVEETPAAETEEVISAPVETGEAPAVPVENVQPPAPTTEEPGSESKEFEDAKETVESAASPLVSASTVNASPTNEPESKEFEDAKETVESVASPPVSASSPGIPATEIIIETGDEVEEEAAPPIV